MNTVALFVFIVLLGVVVVVVVVIVADIAISGISSRSPTTVISPAAVPTLGVYRGGEQGVTDVGVFYQGHPHRKSSWEE
jgi:hypothetical protein